MGKYESKDADLNREINSKLEYAEKSVYTILHAVRIPYVLSMERNITRIQTALLFLISLFAVLILEFEFISVWLIRWRNLRVVSFRLNIIFSLVQSSIF